MGDGQQDGTSTNGDSDGASLERDLGDLLGTEGDELGAVLMGQLETLIETWARVIEALARHGVDPTPLLRTLAGTLRATADQLDPSAHAEPP
jgi:hypothetical protein